MLNRRTFHKTVAATLAALAVPKLALAVQADPVAPSSPLRIQSGDYALAAFSGVAERKQGQLWYKMTPEYAWNMIRQHGVYHADTDAWWIKLMTVNRLDTPLGWKLSGGIMTLFNASYLAKCSWGHQDEVLKDRLGLEVFPEELAVLHTSKKAVLYPRLNLDSGPSVIDVL